MLRQNLGSVKDIAYTTGFNSAPYFCACFKKEYGRSLCSVYLDKYSKYNSDDGSNEHLG